MPIKSRSILYLISAPSGAGKTTICESLLEHNPNLTRAITCTTRAPRKGEVGGQDYYFLKADTFLKKVQAGEFLEHATVHRNSYGTLKSEVVSKLLEGKDVLLNIDVQGEATIRKMAMDDPVLGPALVTVFLVTKTLAELENRLRKRGADSEEIIQVRLEAAEKEVLAWKRFDYLLVSSTFDEDFRRAQMIYEVEKLKTPRMINPLSNSPQ